MSCRFWMRNVATPLGVQLDDLDRVSTGVSMVRGEGPDLNHLFEVLADWERELETLEADQLNDLGIGL